MITLSVLVFILVLGLLVIVHEIGHFILARVFKIGVDEFGIGFPPRLFGFRRGETLYSINWIPIGGFVKIKGVVGGDQMDSPTDLAATQDSTKGASFSDKPIWQRFLILFAGIGMNLVLAIVLFALGYIIGMPSATYDLPPGASISEPAVVIVDFTPEATADEAGLQIGDIIHSVDDQTVTTADDLQVFFGQLSTPETVEVTVERGKDNLVVQEVQTIPLENGKFGLGTYFAETGIVKLPWYQAVWFATIQTFELTKTIILALVGVIAGLFTSEQVDSSLSGPLGIASLTHQATQLGFVYVLQFAALLSINLAIFNLFPFPALDGGRIAFLLYEIIARRPINPRVEAVIHNVGFILLLLIIVAVTIKDVFSFF